MKNVIIVPKDKCPLEVLAEMGNRTRYAWIFLHKNVLTKLSETCDDKRPTSRMISTIFSWNKTQNFPDTFLSVEYFSDSWSSLICIRSTAIAFCSRCDEPTEILFFKMAE